MANKDIAGKMSQRKSGLGWSHFKKLVLLLINDLSLRKLGKGKAVHSSIT